MSSRKKNELAGIKESRESFNIYESENFSKSSSKSNKIILGDTTPVNPFLAANQNKNMKSSLIESKQIGKDSFRKNSDVLDKSKSNFSKKNKSDLSDNKKSLNKSKSNSKLSDDNSRKNSISKSRNSKSPSNVNDDDDDNKKRNNSLDSNEDGNFIISIIKLKEKMDEVGDLPTKDKPKKSKFKKIKRKKKTKTKMIKRTRKIKKMIKRIKKIKKMIKKNQDLKIYLENQIKMINLNILTYLQVLLNSLK